MSISIKTAELVLKATVEKATEIGVPMNIAILDLRKGTTSGQNEERLYD